MNIEPIIIDKDTDTDIKDEDEQPLEEIFNDNECCNIHVAIVDDTPICYLSHGFYSVCSYCCCIFCCKKVCVCCSDRSKMCESKTCGNCNFDDVQLKKSKIILDSGWGDIIEQQKDIRRNTNIKRNTKNHKTQN